MIYIDDITPEMEKEYKIKAALAAKELEEKIQENIEPVEITEENLHSARFANDERDVIEALIGENDEYEAVAIVVDPEDELFQQLMTVTNLDEIELETLELIEREREAIQRLHVDLISNGDTNLSEKVELTDGDKKKVLKEIVIPGVASEEDLFKIKLLAFDLPEVIDAPIEVKEAIRKAENHFDVIVAVKTYVDSL